MNIPVILIIGFFTLSNISSYFVGLLHPPKYTVFTGAVHYPLDYLYYLSFITQGAHHWFTSSYLFTGEPMKREVLNWMYVLGGHIGSLVHLSPPITYQIMVVLSSVLYLWVAYKCTEVLIPNNKTKNLLFYVLFLLSNEFPNIYTKNGSWIFSYYYPWNNIGEPFIRLTNVPHHLVIQACIMAIFYLFIAYFHRKKPIYIVGLSISALLLSSMQPLQWAFITVILGTSGLYAAWHERKAYQSSQSLKKGVVLSILPSGIFFLIGLPSALYLSHFYSRAPYNLTLIWENLQHVYLTFWQFIQLQGPLMILALIGLFRVIRKGSIATFPLIVYSVAATVLFFSPLPKFLHILNLRFFSVIFTLTIAYISTDLIWFLASRFKPQQPMILAWFFAFLALVITIPVTAQQLVDRSIFVTEDVNIYLPIGALQGYREAEKVMNLDDILLLPPMYSSTFTALTGRHVFAASSYTTIDFERKNKEISDFFSPTGAPEDKIAWLHRNHISYIIALAWNPVDLPELQKLYENLYTIVYRVKQ